jgi:hypothetical protein
MRDTAGAERSGERLLSLRGLFLVVPVLLFAFLQPLLANTDPDYWWHTRTGQYIVETGTLPRTDMYSYTAAGQPWVPHEWLTEVVFHVVSQVAGYAGNAILFGLISALTILIVYLLCRLWHVGELGATMLALWAFAMSAASLGVRPQMVTMLFFACAVLLLTLYIQGNTRALWPLPVLFIIWVNLHGGYIIGLALLCLTVAGVVLSRLLKRPAPPLRPLVLITLLCFVATLVSPNGVSGLTYPVTYYAGTQNASMRYISEWQSPDFHLLAFMILASGLLLAMLVGLGQAPLGLAEALWGLGLGFMALQSVRHIPLFAVTIVPLVGARLQQELPLLRRSLADWHRSTLAVVGVLLLLLVVGGGAYQAKKGNGLQTGTAPSTATFPAGGLAYLQSHDLTGNLFNEYVWGGFLINALYPHRPVFIDGRADVYGDAIIEDYLAVTRLYPNWKQVLEKYSVGLVLVPKDSPLAVVLSGDAGWQEAYSGEVERLFVRR